MIPPTEPEFIFPESLEQAIATFQAKLPHIGKDNTAKVPTKTGGEYSYKYTDLTALHDIVFPLLEKVGLTWVTTPKVTEAGFVLEYWLTHWPTAEQIGGEWPLPPVSSGSQALGSAVTYARRYALIAVLGLAPGGEDDDGKAASQPAPKPVTQAQKPPTVGVPPEGWRAKLAAVTDLDQMQELYDTEAHRWYTDEVKLAFKARKTKLVADSAAVSS